MNALGTFFKDFSWKSALVGFVIALAIGAFFAFSQRGTIGELRSELRDIKSSLDTATATAASYKAQLDKSERAVSDATAANSRLESELGSAQSRATELKGQLDRANEQLRAISSGSSMVASSGQSALGFVSSAAGLVNKAIGLLTGGTGANQTGSK